MTLRQLQFVANSREVSGTVTRFAIVACKLDAARRVVVLTLVLDWVLREQRSGASAQALATPWQARFYTRDAAGRTQAVASVELTAADAVETRTAQGSVFAFHAQVELTLPMNVPVPALEASVRRVERVMRSPAGDLMGYVEAPDLDPEPGAFDAEVSDWLEGGRMSAVARADSGGPRPGERFDRTGSGPAYSEGTRRSQERHKSGPESLPQLPAAKRSPTHETSTEPVDAAVFCPPSVCPASSFLVQVFLYPPSDAAAAAVSAREADVDAERRGVLALPLDLPRGTRVDLHFEMPGWRVDEPDAATIWRGRLVSVQFEVAVPADAHSSPLQFGDRKVIGRIRFSIAGVPAGTLRFQVAVAAARAQETARAAELAVRRYRRAFVSYSSQDRAEVLRRVQAFRIAGLSVFQDVLDLEPGERWQRKLYQVIDSCDVLLLFWSRAAAASPWVDKEIDYALARQAGRDDHPPEIVPVPIEGPPIPPPPPKLCHLHFNDALLAHIAAAQGS